MTGTTRTPSPTDQSTSVPLLTVQEQQRINALVQTYEEIARTRMQGIPVLNTALHVQALGFARMPASLEPPESEFYLCGILITPWFMSLLRLPAFAQFRSEGKNLQVGVLNAREINAQTYDFLTSYEDAVGAFESCSLFSPMFEFATQADAVATATEVLAQLRAPVQEKQSAPTTVVATKRAEGIVERPSRRGFLLGRSSVQA